MGMPSVVGTTGADPGPAVGRTAHRASPFGLRRPASVDHDVGRQDRVVPARHSVFARLHRSTQVRARPRRPARRRGEPDRVRRLDPDTHVVGAPDIRWRAQTPSTTTSPSGRTLRVVAGALRGPVQARVLGGLAREERLENLDVEPREVDSSPSQNSSVPTTCASGAARRGSTRRATRPPMPTA